MEDSKLFQIIETIAPALAERSAQQDRENQFVSEGYRLLKAHGFFGAGIPAALGGMGASHAEMAEALRRLARSCPATGLAAAMHTHLVAATVWKYLRGQGGEPLLRRVAQEGLVLVSTGANDWFESNGLLESTTGGFFVSARKAFCSGVPEGDLLLTSAIFENPTAGAEVYHFPVSCRAEGVEIEQDWDALGMRGTGSQTVVFHRVFVPEASIVLRRPRQGWHPYWSVVLTVAPPLFMAPYLGIAEVARDRAIECAAGRRRSETSLLVGEMENSLALARLAWCQLVRNAENYAFDPSVERANAALIAKTLVADAVLATVQKAMEVAGGAGFFRRTGVERLWRDAQAAHYHPLPRKRQQLVSVRIALGLDPLSEAS